MADDRRYVRAEGPAFDLIGCAGIGLALATRDGTLISVNDAFCSILDRSRPQLVGASLASLVAEDDRAAIDTDVRRIADREIDDVTRLARYRVDGDAIRVGRTSLAHYDDGSGSEPCVAALVQDVTQLDNASELSTLLACLRHEQRVHEQFVADVAHDLRTPLTVLSAELELLHAHFEHDMETRRIVRRLMNELRRVDHLAGNLLIVSNLDAKRAPGSMLPIGFDEIVLESIELYAAASAQKGVRWAIEVDEDADVLADPAALRRAVSNVIDNAVKYLPPEGTIEVRLERSDGSVVLSVIDDGPGIPDDEIDHVCERFYRGTLARDKPGTGLGLAIVRSVVEAQGGTLRISSNADGGTHVRLALPAHSR